MNNRCDVTGAAVVEPRQARGSGHKEATMWKLSACCERTDAVVGAQPPWTG